ncbi:MAG: hypothetical protein Q9182_004492 [Xanthomendoza sp. 2 TL-2023]
MTLVSEADILGPVDPKLHSDHWPIHHLRKVNVVSQQVQQSVSLLESHKDHAVQVTGILDAVDLTHGQKILDTRWRNKRIEISNVSFWAFSEEEPHRSISLWASGTAGWFQLHDPIPQYQEIFKGMNEAVSMLYHLADKCRRSRKNYSYMTIKDLNRFVRSAFLDDVYDEVESRLHPQRQPKQAKVRAQNAQPKDQRKSVSTARATENHSQPVYAGRSTRRHPGPQAPRTPNPKSIPNGEADTSGDEEYDSSGKVIEAGTKRKSRSILQPKGSKFSKKTAGRRRSLPSIVDGPAETDNASTESDNNETPGLPEASPLAAISTQHQGPLYPYHPPVQPIEVEMLAYDIPTDRPQGPGDVWTCQFENCNQRVHEASKAKGKALIKAHFQDHARKAQEKIDLVVKESRPYLPVG